MGCSRPKYVSGGNETQVGSAVARQVFISRNGNTSGTHSSVSRVSKETSTPSQHGAQAHSAVRRPFFHRMLQQQHWRSGGHQSSSCKLWCIVETIPSDPVVSLFVSSSVCLIGTILGRVVGFWFQPPLDQRLRSSVATDTASECPVAEEPSNPGKPQPDHLCKQTRRRTLSSCFPPRQRRKCPPNVLLFSEPWLPLTEPTAPNRSGFPGTLHLYAAYSDDTIRALFVDEQNTVYAVLGNSICRKWSPMSDAEEQVRLLQSRLSPPVKLILQYNQMVLMTSTAVTYAVHLPSESIQSCPLLLIDKETTLCDYDGTYILSVTRYLDGPSIIRVAKFPSHEANSCSRPMEYVFQHEVKRSKRVGHLYLWGKNKIVFTTQERCLHAHSWRNDAERFVIEDAHATDIVNVDASYSKRLISIAQDKILRIWSKDAGQLVLSLSLVHLHFYTSFTTPRMVTLPIEQGRWVFFAADQGVFLLDLGDNVGHLYKTS